MKSLFELIDNDTAFLKANHNAILLHCEGCKLLTIVDETLAYCSNHLGAPCVKSFAKSLLTNAKNPSVSQVQPKGLTKKE